jgi:hypothetical protein
MFQLPWPLYSLHILFGSASRTVAVKFQFVIEDPESLLARDTGLQRFDAFTLKFHDFATDQADQMVMVFALGAMLKTRHSITKLARRPHPLSVISFSVR